MKTYTIAKDEHYGWLTGLTDDGRQVLCADGGNIYFDSTGTFLSIEDNAEGHNWEKRADELITTPSPIHVQAFILPGRSIGIKQMPESYEEFLRKPQSFSEDDRAQYPDRIATWKKDDMFVFLLGDDFWMDPDGTVNSH